MHTLYLINFNFQSDLCIIAILFCTSHDHAISSPRSCTCIISRLWLSRDAPFTNIASIRVHMQVCTHQDNMSYFSTTVVVRVWGFSQKVFSRQHALLIRASALQYNLLLEGSQHLYRSMMSEDSKGDGFLWLWR